jgi:RNA polymerase subunit RPABC4/transcription elongation factor Spt4
MGFCQNCGAQIVDGTSQFCPNCGAPIAQQQFNGVVVDNEVVSKGNQAKTLGIVALVCSFFIPLVAWICGGIGLSNSKKAYIATGDERYKKYKNMCITAIIIGVVVWVLSFISVYTGFTSSLLNDVFIGLL